MRRFLTIVLFLLFPSMTLAAGFAKQSLFLSQSTVIEGQTVFVYAVVNDESPTNFIGTLSFKDESGQIGTVSVKLEAGKATTASVSWKPKAGTHTVTATLTSSAGDVVESEDAVFVVNPTPVPANSQSTSSQSHLLDTITPQTTDESTVVASSTPIVNGIARILPQVAAKSEPIFESIDSWRSKATNKLNQDTSWSKKNLSEAATAQNSIKNTLWLILNTFVLYLCSALAYAVANIGIFYPVLVFIFFYLMWKTYKMFRR